MLNTRHLIPFSVILSLIIACSPSTPESTNPPSLEWDKQTLLDTAQVYLKQAPVPITASSCERSAGGIHDFYSEGDYWWPDPNNPDGPYIRRDGQSNPANFTTHRENMRDFSRWVAALTAAFKLSKEAKYADQARQHLMAWLVNEETRMSPHLLYAQAISGRVTGRGIGIIDGIHLIDVAQSIQYLHQADALPEEYYAKMKQWFADFVDWLTTHPYGVDERDHGNNHSTWWAAQVAAFAQLAGREDIMVVCRSQFKKLLTEQMDSLGRFPDELSRTKPYNYTLFNLEGYSILAHIASSPADNLWEWEGPKGGLKTAWAYMFPFVANKSAWPLEPDVQHFEELPIQTTGLLLASLAWQKADYLTTWKGLSPVRLSKEVDRNFPLRQPSLWVD